MSSDSCIPDAVLDRWQSLINEKVSGGSPVASIRLFPMSGKVSDETTKGVATGERGNPLLFLLATQASDNDLVKRGGENAARIREALPDPLHHVVLAPRLLAEADGMRLAVYDYHAPIGRSRFIGRRVDVPMLPKVTRWLGEAIDATKTRAQIGSDAEQDLQAFVGCKELPGELLDSVADAIERFHDGSWAMHQTIMHGDLWRENILRAKPSRDRTAHVIIDWPGAGLDGYPFFDLIRLLRSFSMPQLQTKRAMSHHLQVLDAEPREIDWYLAAALGRVRRNLGNFDYHQFLQMSVTVVNFARRYRDPESTPLFLRLSD